MSSTSTPIPETGPNDAGFVFGKPGEGGPNKIIGLLPVNTYLVSYTDGGGKKSVRLVFKAPEMKSAFILNEKVQGAFVATEATAWFNKSLASKLKEKGLENDPGVGKEGAEAI